MWIAQMLFRSLFFSTQLQNPSCCFNYPMKSPSSSPTPLFKLILSPPVWSGTISMCHLHLCVFCPLVLCIVCVGTSGLSGGLMEALCLRFLDDAQLKPKQIHHVMFYLKVNMKSKLPIFTFLMHTPGLIVCDSSHYLL